MEKWLTCEEVAKRYEVKIERVWAWIRAGILPAFRVSRLYRIAESDLVQFENANRK